MTKNNVDFAKFLNSVLTMIMFYIISPPPDYSIKTLIMKSIIVRKKWGILLEVDNYFTFDYFQEYSSVSNT